MPSNCPAILQGYSKPCRDTQGGVKKFWVTEAANIESYTEASGVITAITFTAGKKFWLVEQEFQTASATEAPQSNRQTGATFWEQTVNMVLHKRSASTSYWLRSMMHQDLVIVVQEEQQVSGVRVNTVFGVQNGLSLDPSESTTGVNQGDLNGYTLVYKGSEPHGAYTISQALIDSND